MEVRRLKAELNDLKSSLVRNGILNDQFKQLYLSGVQFVIYVIPLFFVETERILNEMTRNLNQDAVNYSQIEPRLHQLKGTFSSIGAPRVVNACSMFANNCTRGNCAGCEQYLKQLIEEYFLLKGKLEGVVELEKAILAAEGSV